MTQNTSPAVMAQRKEPDDSLDDFPTPPWATRALCELLGGQSALSIYNCLEPACGRGHMTMALREYFGAVSGSDVHDYGFGEFMVVDDFLFPGLDRPPFDFVITNPPFRLAAQFIKKAREVATKTTAMLVRSQFLEGQARYLDLFKPNPPTIIAQFVERVPMFRGRCVRYTVDKNGKKHRAATATAYTWLIWTWRHEHPEFRWIAPCRERLERFGDYDDDQPGYSHTPALEAAG